MRRLRLVFAAALVIVALVFVAPGLSAHDHRFDARAVGSTASTRIAHAPPRARLLFAAAVVASDFAPVGFKPTSDIYSLSSTGRLAQLTFTGGNHPVPSPDGRLVAFVRGGDLWLMSPDGSRQRRLARSGTDPAWTPNSRRVAYVSTDGKGGSRGIRVIKRNGTGVRWLVRGPVTGPAWSPDGRSLAFLRTVSVHPLTSSISIVRAGKQHVIATLGEAAPPSWSSDGRWLAYSGCTDSCGVSCCTVFVARPNGRDRHIVSINSIPVWSGQGHELVWSPRGQVLAFVEQGSIRTFDAATDRRHLVTYLRRSIPSSIAWSPDGSRIAYDRTDETEDSELYTVSLRGRVHSLGSYPDAASLVWSTPPANLHYQAPQPLAVAAGDELKLRLPVDELAADGDAVAYITCELISVWRPPATTVTTVRDEVPLCGPEGATFGVYGLALAGDQVGWGEVIGGGTSQASTLFVAPVEANAAGHGPIPARPSEVVAGNGQTTGGDPRGTSRVGYLLGAGPLLVFSTWLYCDQVYPSSCFGLPPLQRPLVSQTLWRMREASWPGACPGAASAATNYGLPSAQCQQLRVEMGRLRPLDVDAGRVVVGGDNATLILDQDGRQLLSLPISTQAAQLAGSDLVAVVQGELRDYDAMTGALLHTYPLPFVSSGGFCGVPAWLCGYVQFRLEDAARGLVAYIAGGPSPGGDASGELHLLRLADGRDVVVHAATAARFDDAGLVYAYTTSGIWPGRIRFTPFDQLPLQ